MKKIDHFTNRYSLSKTLRFKLVPVGKTAETFDSELLAQEEKRAKDAKVMKKIIDRYHKDFIQRSLCDFSLSNLEEYAKIYYCSERTVDKLDELSEKMRAEIAKRFKACGCDKLLKGEFIKKELPDFVADSEKELVESFSRFTTYFTDYNKNRENMYTGEGNSTEIAFRIVDQNLPKFLDNVKVGEMIRNTLPKESLDEIESNFAKLFSFDIKEIFTVSFFNHVLTQFGIDEYNQIIGGYTTKDGKKIQGYNEYVNLYNQTATKKLPKLKRLYKQILSDHESISFVPEKFADSNEVLSALNRFYNDVDSETGFAVKDVVDELAALFENIADYDLNCIYVTSGVAVSDLSKSVYGHWAVIRNGLYQEYEKTCPRTKKKSIEAYEDDRRKYFNKIKSYSVVELQNAGNRNISEDLESRAMLTDYISERVLSLASEMKNAYSHAEKLILASYPADKLLYQEEDDIVVLKAFLESAKNLQNFVKMFIGSGMEEDKDLLFYGRFSDLYDQLEHIIPLYNKVRDYVTQKPYSDEKFKLCFDNPQLLGGWDNNKERDYYTVLLRRSGMYYLAIMRKGNTKLFIDYPVEQSDGWEKMEYKLLPGPNKMLPKVFFAKSNIDRYAPDSEIMKIYKHGTFKKGKDFSLNDCHAMIAFYQSAIEKHPDWSKFGFRFKSPDRYADIGEFYKEVELQGYNVKFKPISAAFLEKQVESGNLFLFRLYNKDFSPCSKGMPNLHTMYFRALFDERNLDNVCYKLDGGAEMFYRKRSIDPKKAVTHPANQPLENKNNLNEKNTSTFPYELVKDRRYTERQFTLHMPIRVNFKSKGKEQLNMDVRNVLRESDNIHVIGIDRGERNLLYISVINGKGEIVEQFSMNQIHNEYRGTKYSTDYHELLDRREAERKAARVEWKTIHNIKDLKEGYISQVVHEICELVEKYDAIIAMEDLNAGFKNSRAKVEKQVYQKFEKMLIDKLNFYVNKQTAPDDCGGLLHAYQLTEKFQSFGKMRKQNGFIFYVPAWLTSKIDPVTGFVDLLRPRYTSVSEAKRFFALFDRIEYDSQKDRFEFDIDYGKFPGGATSARKIWTLVSSGNRIKAFRNSENNSRWDYMVVDVTKEMKAHFEKFSIDYCAAECKKQILLQDTKEFFEKFIHLFALLLQMRNSNPHTGDDYLISPVLDEQGNCFDSRNRQTSLPVDADANGAYHIAKKAQWVIGQIKNRDQGDLGNVNMAISNKEWLAYVQNGEF